MASKQGKSITTSVPTISIKFHANAEQIEELYGSDDEQKSELNEKKLSAAIKEKGSNSTGNIQDTAESSPLKHLRQNKRSSSTDVATNPDSSPPSDPWKFFSEIRGKIAKSVEDKITEIKARNQEDGSPSRGKTEPKIEKNTKENSSLSDSEDLSESSLSRTCGIVSTTEGVEMSSDEDSTSLKNETPTNLKLPRSPTLPITPTLRQRFKLLKASKNGSTVSKEGTVSMSNLTKIYNMTTDDTEQAFPEHNEEIESGVDALEDADYKDSSTKMVRSDSEVLTGLEHKIDNIQIDNDGTVIVREAGGFRWRGESSGDDGDGKVMKTVYAPKGFVDFRYRIHKSNRSFLFFILVLSISILYLLIQKYSTYIAGMIAGIFITVFSYYVMNKFSMNSPGRSIKENQDML
ncbi:hypothetical protein HHI36_014701 [Cryptolaemus montrouzieri]|uniref:Uncharacterized protein n=1 Tax=Cryptolaemus montrouzieri TaxID=559131 RepID=A0ABD2N3Y9_9CUCU